MWGSLDVLDVGFFLVCNSAVLEFLGGDLVSSIADLAGALPVPVKASHVLESGHFFVGQVCDNLKHMATVAVDTEDVVVHELLIEPDLLDSN